MCNSMKNLLRTITNCLILLTLTFFISSCNQKNTMDVNDREDQEWTFLLYDNADTRGRPSLLDDYFADVVWSGKNVNYLVLQDVTEGPAMMWYIDEDHSKVLLEEMGEINMASSETLYNFLSYAKMNYPADQYILSMAGTGRTWCYMGRDLAGNRDYLLLDEMRKALSDAGGVDIVIFCGSCCMGSLESAYELRGCTDFYIASEDWTSYAVWQYPLQSICNTLHSQPGISNQDLAEMIVEFIEQNEHVGWWNEELTMSAVRMDKIVPLKEAVEVLAEDYYLNDKDKFLSQVNSVIHDIQNFPDTDTDVYDIAEKLLTVEQDQGLRVKLENVKNCLQEAVISEFHSDIYPNAHGLTIYLPNVPEVPFNYQYPNEEYRLDFIIETYWDELLLAYVDGR